MKELKSILLASALSGSIAMPALASDAQPAPAPVHFTTAEAHSIFEQDAKPMQLAELSQQEMKETEGAWIWVPLYYGAIYAPQMSALAWTAYRAAPTFGNTWNTWYPRVTNWWSR